MRNSVGWALAAMLASLAACGDSTGPSASLDCSSVQPAALSPGQFTIIDPLSQGPCAVLPSAGSGGAEYLFAAVATAGVETQKGLSAPYTLAGSGGGAVASVAALPSPLVRAFRPPTNAARFHHMLRLREQAEAASPAARFNAAIVRRPAFAVTAPSVGNKKTFNVCSNTDCAAPFTQVTATAMNVGAKVAIYQEDNLPSGAGFSQTDIDNVAHLFDNYLYPIDTTNFGPETDFDNNGVVEVLLSGAINKLSQSFCKDGSVILGYFLSSDLLATGPGNTGSNEGEVFYSIVPDPNGALLPGCQPISVSFAQRNLAPTFIHEFQHMISYGQKVLVKKGTSAEETWLNEGMSHYAEELGGRLIPDNQNPTLPAGSNTYAQFALSDYQNAYDYLSTPEQTFLIEPLTSNGDLNERGANWLFVRWLVEGFGTATPNAANFTVRATNMTQQLVQTRDIGANNVEQRTGRSFNDLVVLWQLANYLDNLPGFVPVDSLLQYQNADLRYMYAQLHASDGNTFARVYPLIPDSTQGQYSRSGTLKQGSARHVRMQQAAGAPSMQLKLTGSASSPISATIVPRIGLVRIK